MTSLEERVAALVRERIDVMPYSPDWPEMFEKEKAHLIAVLPAELIGRVVHFGSTAVPGLAAKPIIDILVEVFDMTAAKTRLAPILEDEGYDYLFRPSFGDSTPPFYAWFIKRNAAGERTHHIHMVEPHFEHWQRLRFRDYLIAHPEARDAYGALKETLSRTHPNDRVAYTEGKTAFILKVMSKLG